MSSYSRYKNPELQRIKQSEALKKCFIKRKRKELGEEEFLIWYEKYINKQQQQDSKQRIKAVKEDLIAAGLRGFELKNAVARAYYQEKKLSKEAMKKDVFVWLKMMQKNTYKREQDVKWAFWYFAKKGIVCRFPDIFNGKKVKRFDPNGRPIGAGDVDLVAEYYSQKENGFTIAQNTKHIKNHIFC